MSSVPNPASLQTLVLVEDEPQTRERLADVIRERPEISLVAAVESFREGRRAIERHAPDVLLTDLGLPDGDGTELIRLAVQRRPETLCMVITVFGDEHHVLSAIQAGALGYLLKDGRADQLGEAILEMLGGGSPISAPIARQLLRRLPAGDAATPPPPDDVPQLSPREHEVLRCVVKGFTVPEIARLLGVSSHTVTTHVRGIYRKLSVHSRGEAIYEALQLGLVQIDE